MRYRTVLLIFLGLVALLRFLAIGATELSPDEAYHALRAETLDWGYHGSGPGVATAVAAGVAWLGPVETGVRLAFVLFGLGTGLLAFALGRRLFDARAGFWAAVLVSAIPLFHTGAMQAGPLMPSLFFWLACLLGAWMAIEKSPRFSAGWPLAGLCAGLGFQFAYGAAFALPAIAFFLACSRNHRRDLLRPGIWSAALVFALCALPLLRWNLQNEWVAVAHLGADRLPGKTFSLTLAGTLEFLVRYFREYSPLLVLGLLAALPLLWRRARLHVKPRYLLCAAAGYAVLHLLLLPGSSANSAALAPAFAALVIAVCGVWMERWWRGPGGRVFAVAAVAVAFFFSAWPRDGQVERFDWFGGPAREDGGWRAAAEALAALRAEVEAAAGEPFFLIAQDHRLAAGFAFYLPERRLEYPGHPPVYIPESQHMESQFSLWPRYDAFVLAAEQDEEAFFTEQKGVNLFLDRPALFVTELEEMEPDQRINSAFERCDLLAEIEVSDRGLRVRTLRVFACYAYQTLPL